MPCAFGQRCRVARFSVLHISLFQTKNSFEDASAAGFGFFFSFFADVTQKHGYETFLFIQPLLTSRFRESLPNKCTELFRVMSLMTRYHLPSIPVLHRRTTEKTVFTELTASRSSWLLFVPFSFMTLKRCIHASCHENKPFMFRTSSFSCRFRSVAPFLALLPCCFLCSFFSPQTYRHPKLWKTVRQNINTSFACFHI